MPLENTNPQVRREGLVTDRATSLRSTLSVTGAATLLSTLAITGVLTLSAAVTGTTGTFSGVLESETSVSSVQFHSSGANEWELGKAGETVSSVPITVVGATNVLESEGSVSSNQFHASGAVTFELGKSGETVSSVPINIAGITGQDITASSTAATDALLIGFSGLTMINPADGTSWCLTVTSANPPVPVAGAC